MILVESGVMSSPRPNLFDLATSELSQDAVLCWCIAWADRAHAAADPDLHRLGRDLVAAMLRAGDVEPPDGEYTVTVKRQLERIDIVAEIGDTHLLAIEDKVHALELHNPLDEYIKRITARYPDRRRLFLFLKTGDQSSYGGVRAGGWTPFLRQQILEVLRNRGSTNAIYRDFLDSLERRDTVVQRYRTVPVASWGPRDPAYVGLYTALQAEFPDGHWGDVPNKSGGFLGFWWNIRPFKGGKIYLQLEEEELVAKIEVEHVSRRSELRKSWSKRVTDGISKFTRPRRFGKGRCMTVASFAEYRVEGPDGRLDLDATVHDLKAATDALSRLVGPPAAS